MTTERFFNTAGPTRVDQHHHPDPFHRLDWDEIQWLIQQQRYFGAVSENGSQS